MKTAVVHDWLNGMRGGEKVLEAILPLVPDPTVFTLFHVPGSVSAAIERYPIRASYLNLLPFSRGGYRNYLPLFARAVESFDLSGFDLVVSSSHCVAKGAIAPGQRPPSLLLPHAGPVRVGPVRRVLPGWNFAARPQALLRRAPARMGQAHGRAGRPAISPTPSAVAERIRRHYGREATVCHPPVDVAFYTPSESPRRDFLLCVGALVPYKRFGDAVAAAKSVGRPLTLVGRGPEEKRLRAMAGSSVNIVADRAPEELRELYRTCAAFVQPGEEDFGIAAVEALACGAPVIALARGGACDIVEDGKNGVLFTEQGPAGLAAAVKRAAGIPFDYNSLRASALRFAPEAFKKRFTDALHSVSSSLR